MSTPDYDTIHRVYRDAAQVIERLPESTETRRAAEHLKLARDYTFRARERAGPADEPGQGRYG